MLDKKCLIFGGAFFMGRYPDEVKLAVIKYCVDESHSINEAMKKFNIPTSSTVRDWVNKYKEHGLNGIHKNPSSFYTGEFKMEVLKYMYANKLSYLATAYHFNLGNHKIVQIWEQKYKEKGPEVFNIENRGRKRKMNKRKSTPKKLSKDDEKAFRDEIKQLRMENEYLKKLNALVQERIVRENKKK